MRILARLLAAILFLTLAIDASAAHAATKPSAPRSVKATPGNGTVKVSWTAPSSNGGASIDRYAVQQRNTPTASWVTVKYTTASARSWTKTGLTNGAKYYFRVLAHNRLGTGTASAQVSATPRTVPNSPTYLEADLYDAALGAFWLAPANNGGAPIDSYRVDISLDGGATWTNPQDVPVVATKALPLKFTGLTPGSRHWIRVRAHNAAGFSVGFSSGPYRPITAPGPVTDLTGVSGTGQVELSWTAPESTTSAPALAMYKIEKSDDGGTTWSDAGTTTNDSFVVTGLTNGTTYQFRVSARSTIERVGYGTPTIVVPDAPTGAPTVPQNVRYAWDPVANDYVLRWDAPANDGGIDLTRYELEHWNELTPPGADPLVLAPDATQVSAGLYAVSDTAHLRACNGPDEDDCGPWSTDAEPIPGGVQNATAVPSRGEAGAVVTLDWDAPATVATVTSYTVSRSTDSGATWSVLGATDDATQTDWVDDTAAYETDYTYRIVANSDGGSGAWVLASVTTGLAHQLAVSPSTIQVSESGSNTFQVTLDPVVEADTVITVTSDDPGAASVDATVTVATGQTSANVTVNGVADDDLVNESVVITVQLGTQSKTVTVNVTDDDTQAIVLTGTPTTVTVGSPPTFGVALAHQPTGNVTVTVVSQQASKATVSPGTLTFTPANWNTPQNVTITGKSADDSVTISLSSPGLTDASFNVAVLPAP